MTLTQALVEMRQAGYLQAKEDRCRFFKEIDVLLAEAELDLNDYTPNVKTGEIVQNHPAPSTHYSCT